MKSALILLMFGMAAVAAGGAGAAPTKPTIVLVHGAFADASSWSGVIRILERDGYTVVAPANPLRGLRFDADSVAGVIRSIARPVVLVGHSYGGSVISAAAMGQANVQALVYVSAFAPDRGETAAGLAAKFPGSTLGSALAQPVELPDGGRDLYIQPSRFREQFAADVSKSQAEVMAVTQRPITEAALNETSSEPAWKHVPSWFIHGDADRNIPPDAMSFMAGRAGARETEVIRGASHVVMVSHPAAVAHLIERAAERR